MHPTRMSWYDSIFSTANKSAAGIEGTTAPSTTEHELFERFFAGDNAALVELFDRHNNALYQYCLQILDDAELAEDVTQELWERLVRLRHGGRTYPARNPIGLLITMARNLSIDMLRRRKRHADVDDLPETSHPQAHMPELSHLEELVIKAMQHLPDPQREVLVLHEYVGYKFEEIAEMLGEPVGAIRTRAWRARSHLGRIISAMVDLEDDVERTGRKNIPGGSE